MIEVIKARDKAVWKVKLDKKLVGEIRFLNPGFQYFPRGSKEGGGVLPSLNAVIKSLEDYS
jgi:hypothetical protein